MGQFRASKVDGNSKYHNIVRQVVGAFHDHKSVEEYKRYAQIIDSKNAHINALKKENPVDLSSTDVGDILNQNDFLRDTVTMKNKEIAMKEKTKILFKNYFIKEFIFCKKELKKWRR